MVRPELKPPRRTRLGVALLVAALHLIAVTLLVRAFAPRIGEAVLRPVTQAFDVIVTPPGPEPSPPPEPAAASDQGAAAPAGRKAQPREVAAPKPPVVLTPKVAPPVAATGNADSAGARDEGAGTGAGGAGQGLGAGGAGEGNGGAARAVKIAGDIVSARDYPRKTRKLRLGSAVTIVLTVDTEGRASACRIVRPSRDPEADGITCSLATARFRFRPARDGAGRPVQSTYGWQQRWFTPEAE